MANLSNIPRFHGATITLTPAQPRLGALAVKVRPNDVLDQLGRAWALVMNRPRRYRPTFVEIHCGGEAFDYFRRAREHSANGEAPSMTFSADGLEATVYNVVDLNPPNMLVLLTYREK